MRQAGYLWVFLFLVPGSPALADDAAGDQNESPRPGSISQETPKQAEAPLLVGITVHRRPVTTDSEPARRYFQQGLNLMYAFNHDEAIRSFQQATRFDSKCAMAWWGIALANGPHINNPVMDEPRSIAAWKALEKARANSGGGTPVEQSLINALAQRYAANPAENIAQREALNKAYAEAMQRVRAEYPDDTDVAVLCAEALMDLRPWDLWSHEGEPRPETPQVLALLEGVFVKQPNHPGANHLYIHAVEASRNPEKAVAAANRLRTLMPGSGHMVHMPAHIDVRTGRWSQAADQNARAIQVDAAYRKASPQQGFYRLYMLHNHHFLSYAAMMEGRKQVALRAARDMLSSIPSEFLDHSAALADPYLSIEYQVLIRFGGWDELLALPAPREDLPITTAMWRFGLATALAAKGDVAAAEREQVRFRGAVEAVPEDAMGAVNPARDILKVGEHTLAGEIAFQQGDVDAAVAELNKAISAEAGLRYMEPPEWIQPVRHSLGAVLVAAKRWKEAEQVYRADLAQWPENGWSLFGLAQCLEAQGDAAEAKKVTVRFRDAWARADTQIESTCLCVRAAK